MAQMDHAIQTTNGFRKLSHPDGSGAHLLVGTGQHRRLITNKRLSHLETALIEERLLLDFFKEPKNTPTHFVLIPVKGSSAGYARQGKLLVELQHPGYQEFFHRPTISDLFSFFSKPNLLGKERYLLCKAFVRRHKSVSLETVQAAYDEFTDCCQKTFGIGEKGSNVIVLGETKDKKLRLGIIDY